MAAREAMRRVKGSRLEEAAPASAWIGSAVASGRSGRWRLHRGRARTGAGTSTPIASTRVTVAAGEVRIVGIVRASLGGVCHRHRAAGAWRDVEGEGPLVVTGRAAVSADRCLSALASDTHHATSKTGNRRGLARG